MGSSAGLGAVLAALADKPAIRRRAVVALAAFEGEEVEAALARAEAAWLEGRGDEILDELESAYGRVQAQDDHRSREVSGYWLWKLGGRPPVALDVSPSPIDDQMAGRSRIAADRWAAAEHPYHAALALSESEAEEDMKQAVVQFQDLGAAAAAVLGLAAPLGSW